MEMTLLAFLFISIPGLLSATCSSPSQNEPTPSVGYAKSIMNSHLTEKQNGNVQGNPREGAGHRGMTWDYAPSRRSPPPLEQQLENKQQEQVGRCENGWCGEDGSCNCNSPCWSGPTCQEYVDRFSPRFLAEEPFFIVDSTSALTSSPFPSVDSSEENDPLLQEVQPPSSSSSSSSPSSALVTGLHNGDRKEIRKHVESFTQSFTSSPSSNFAAFADSSAKTNSLDFNLSKKESQLSNVQPPEPVVSGSTARSTPLFRIEAADDDLGLTCVLGQVGPAATCPCATPRYKVIGASTTIPDDRSFTSNTYPKETDINRPSQESSFYNSVTETKLLHFPSFSSKSTSEHSAVAQEAKDASRLEDCPRLRATKCKKLNSIMFHADEETGDVFLQNGYSLEPEKYYFITLQVSALPVNSSGYKSWREHIVATLYVKSSSASVTDLETASLQQDFPGLMNDKEQDYIEVANEPTNSKLETLDSQEFYEDEGVDTDTTDRVSAVDDEQLEDAGDKRISERKGHGAPLERSEQFSNYRSDDFGRSVEDNSADYDATNNAPPKEDDEDKQPAKKIMSLKKQNRNLKKTIIPHKIANAKNKLPYALRADRPHFKYSPSSPNLELFGTNSETTYESLVPEERFLSDRKKREVPDKAHFKMFISRVDGEEGNATSFIGMGSVTKLKLRIQVAPTSTPKDFALEIHTSRAKASNIKFIILSAYVTSIGSDISFDKANTNLAPVMIPWKNSTVYERVIWKWKNVTCEKSPDQHRIPAPNQGNNGRERRNDEIFIEFDVVAIYPEESGNVVNRWMSVSSTSATPWQRHEKNKSYGDGGPSPHSHKDLSDDNVDLKQSPLSASIISKSGRKVAKQFNVIPVPVSAYITLSNGHREPGYYHHSFLEHYDEKLQDEVVKIRKEIDEEGDGATTRSRDGIFIKADGSGYDDSLHNSLPNDISTWQSNSAVVSHIMLPVKYSQVPNKSDISGTTNQTHDTVGVDANSTAASIKGKGSKEDKDTRIGVNVVVEGPTEIPQGGWVSYIIKVYLNHSSQFQLRLEPLQGNEIQYQDTVSVGDIRVTDFGKSFTSCGKIPSKNGGFRVTCRKLHGRKGDYCTVESPIIRYCPDTAEEASKSNKAKDDALAASGSEEVSSNQIESESEEKWDSNGGKQNKKTDEMTDDGENMIRFEGVIYGFPGSAPGSQFALRAHVHVQTVEEAGADSSNFHDRSSSADEQLRHNYSVEEEKTLAGTIVHRKQNTLGKNSPGFESTNADLIDGKIPVMKEFPAYHYRKRRNIFFASVLGANKNLSAVNTIGESIDKDMSPHNKAHNFVSDDSNKKRKKMEENLEKVVHKKVPPASQNIRHNSDSKSFAATHMDSLAGNNLFYVNTLGKSANRGGKTVSATSNWLRKSKRSSSLSHLL